VARGVEEVNVDEVRGAAPEDPQGEPVSGSEEDVRRFVEQLRTTPAEQILAEVFSTLLTAAEVKLGRRDARLFIDLCSVLSQQADGYVAADLVDQVGKSLGQLRLGQVSAESHKVGNAEPEPNDLERTPAPPAERRPPAPTGPAESPASRLWVPGR
jgi:hypothetical protein